MSRGEASARPTGTRRVTESITRSLAAGERTFSFEFFPPKDDAGEAVLWDAIRRLEPLAPTFVSVTYGAGGSTRGRTTRITGRIASDTTLTPMAHLTCVGSSRAELRQIIGGYAQTGVNAVLALRGDPPGGPGSAWTPHPEGLDTAIDLVRLVRELSGFSIGVAAVPTKHPESPDLEHDARILAMKADAGADFAITQLFFDPVHYVRFMDLVRRTGTSIPVIPGIMPLTSLRQVERFALLSGTPVSEAVVRRISEVADDPAAVRRVGIDLATELCQALLEAGAPGLHFYTLNRSTATVEIVERLGTAGRVGARVPTARGKIAT
jgi:methylenetetrahydrofolate reductase (NADPH)